MLAPVEKKDDKKDDKKDGAKNTTAAKTPKCQRVNDPSECECCFRGVNKEGTHKLSKEVLESLGLGRGVDATNRSPWLNKTSFQVLKVTDENVMETEGGGIMQSYDNTVTSVREIRSKLGVDGIKLGKKVAIGVECELSRSYNTTRRVYGKKIVTRSYSLRPDFDVSQSFEQHLMSWIDSIKSPETQQIAKSEQKLQCEEFIKRFGITHFVCDMDLGALQYFVKNEEKRTSKVALSNHMKLLDAPIINGSSGVDTTHSSHKRFYTEIGRVITCNANRGTTHEAVVEVSLKPISTLIKDGALRKHFENATEEYIKKKEQEECKIIVNTRMPS